MVNNTYISGRNLLVHEDSLNFLLIDRLAIEIVPQLIRRALEPENLEPIDGRDIGHRSFLGVQVRVSLEQGVRKGGPEVSPVDVQVLLPGDVDLLTPGAVGLNSRG